MDIDTQVKVICPSLVNLPFIECMFHEAHDASTWHIVDIQ